MSNNNISMYNLYANFMNDQYVNQNNKSPENEFPELFEMAEVSSNNSNDAACSKQASQHTPGYKFNTYSIL